MFTLVSPTWLFNWSLNKFTKKFPIQYYDYSFLTDHYIPEIQEALKDVKVSLIQKINLARKFTGMLIKLLYGLIFKETTQNVFVLKLGSFLMPFVNGISSFISGLPNSDGAVTWSSGLYPG